MPGMWPGLEQRILESRFQDPYNGSPFEGKATANGIHSVVPYPNFLRAYYDQDSGRGRYVIADIPYQAVIECISPKSVLGKFIKLRRLDALPEASAPPRPITRRLPAVPHSVQNPHFQKHALRVSRKVLEAPGGSAFTETGLTGLYLNAASYVGAYRVKAGVLEFGPDTDSESWKFSNEADDPFALRTPVGYLFSARHPHPGVQTCLFRMTSKGVEGPVLVSNRRLLTWAVTANVKTGDAALYALLSTYNSEHAGVDLGPDFLVKYSYDGGAFKKVKTWSLRDLNLFPSSPAELRALDVDYDGAEELVVTTGHSGDFGFEDAAILKLEGNTPGVTLLPGVTRNSWSPPARAVLRLHGSLSAGGSLVFTLADRDSQSPSIVVRGLASQADVRFPGLALLVDDLDGDGDMDILARDATSFLVDGELVWYEQVD